MAVTDYRTMDGRLKTALSTGEWIEGAQGQRAADNNRQRLLAWSKCNSTSRCYDRGQKHHRCRFGGDTRCSCRFSVCRESRTSHRIILPAVSEGEQASEVHVYVLRPGDARPDPGEIDAAVSEWSHSIVQFLSCPFLQGGVEFHESSVGED